MGIYGSGNYGQGVYGIGNGLSPVLSIGGGNNKSLPTLPLDANVQLIPLDNSPNQSFQVTLNVDGQVLTLQLTISFNEIAGYWVMTIRDASGNILLDSVPMLTGDAPAANILEQHSYLGIGSAFLVNIEGGSQDYPNATDLGSGFYLLWSDTQ